MAMVTDFYFRYFWDWRKKEIDLRFSRGLSSGIERSERENGK